MFCDSSRVPKCIAVAGAGEEKIYGHCIFCILRQHMWQRQFNLPTIYIKNQSKVSKWYEYADILPIEEHRQIRRKLYVHFNITEQYLQLLKRNKGERQFFDVYFSKTKTDDMILIIFVVLQKQ